MRDRAVGADERHLRSPRRRRRAGAPLRGTASPSCGGAEDRAAREHARRAAGRRRCATRTRTITVLVAVSTSGAIASTAPSTAPTPSTSSSRLLPDADLADARRRHRRAQVELARVGDLDHRRAVAVDGLPGRHQDRRHHAGDGRAQGGAIELHVGGAAGRARACLTALSAATSIFLGITWLY